jgi:hypothetical protein
MINAIKSSKDQKRVGIAWLLLTSAFALHVSDEALTGFLSIYNSTVVALQAKYPWFAMPAFDFREFLTTMICVVVVLFALSPLFFDNVRWARPLGYFAAVVQILNAFGHIIGTVLGRTVQSVHFSRPAPGFYSSPFLLIASAYLLYALAQSRVQPAVANAAMSR